MPGRCNTAATASTCQFLCEQYVIRMMFAESGVLLAIGVAIGVALAAVAMRYAAGLLYGLKPLDATSFVLAISVLGFITSLAAWFPARRASRLAPTVALRE